MYKTRSKSGVKENSKGSSTTQQQDRSAIATRVTNPANPTTAMSKEALARLTETVNSLKAGQENLK